MGAEPDRDDDGSSRCSCCRRSGTRWRLLGRDIPGLGVVLTVVIVLVNGLLARASSRRASAGLLERAARPHSDRALDLFEREAGQRHHPASPNGQAFRRALVQYPRSGVWTIAFQTGTPADEVRRHIVLDMVSVYVPTTPTPPRAFS